MREEACIYYYMKIAITLRGKSGIHRDGRGGNHACHALFELSPRDRREVVADSAIAPKFEVSAPRGISVVPRARGSSFEIDDREGQQASGGGRGGDNSYIPKFTANAENL